MAKFPNRWKHFGTTLGRQLPTAFNLTRRALWLTAGLSLHTYTVTHSMICLVLTLALALISSAILAWSNHRDQQRYHRGLRTLERSTPTTSPPQQRHHHHGWKLWALDSLMLLSGTVTTVATLQHLSLLQRWGTPSVVVVLGLAGVFTALVVWGHAHHTRNEQRLLRRINAAIAPWQRAHTTRTFLRLPLLLGGCVGTATACAALTIVDQVDLLSVVSAGLVAAGLTTYGITWLQKVRSDHPTVRGALAWTMGSLMGMGCARGTSVLLELTEWSPSTLIDSSWWVVMGLALSAACASWHMTTYAAAHRLEAQMKAAPSPAVELVAWPVAPKSTARPDSLGTHQTAPTHDA